jgi:hypothetical protein
VNDRLKRICKKRSWPNLRHNHDICLEGLSKTTKNLSQDSPSPGQDLNPRPPEYEAEVLIKYEEQAEYTRECREIS